LVKLDFSIVTGATMHKPVLLHLTLLACLWASTSGCSRDVTIVDLAPPLKAAGWDVAIVESYHPEGAVRLTVAGLPPSLHSPIDNKRWLALRVTINPPHQETALVADRIKIVDKQGEYSSVAFAMGNASRDFLTFQHKYAPTETFDASGTPIWSVAVDTSNRPVLMLHGRNPHDLLILFDVPDKLSNPVLRVE
jgi:hypothetical protein